MEDRGHREDKGESLSASEIQDETQKTRPAKGGPWSAGPLYHCVSAPTSISAVRVKQVFAYGKDIKKTTK